MCFQYLWQMLRHHITNSCQFFFAHGRDLSYTKYRVVDCKLLEILEADILCTLAFQVASCIEHFLRHLLQVNI